MSTSEEIQAVYEKDIYDKTHLVVSRKGVGSLLEGAHGMHIEGLFAPTCGDGSLVHDFRVPRERDRDAV